MSREATDLRLAPYKGNYSILCLGCDLRAHDESCHGKLDSGPIPSSIPFSIHSLQNFPDFSRLRMQKTSDACAPPVWMIDFEIEKQER
ncbi:MAG: hypothetical protein DWI02_08310 [Planctomycetota bacterium]|nr:MAG: hypothetical protein DWI02_08310 [Planctomycetota bacterium]